jgi:hypothetical protein
MGRQHAWRGREIHIGSWWESQKERGQWEDNIKMDIRERVGWYGLD